MPLDPHAKRLLSLLAASGGSGTRRPSAADRRRAFRQLMQSADDGQVPAVAVENTSFPGPGGSVAIRIHNPEIALTRVSPGLIYFHGGGWVAGDLDTYDRICGRLAEESGCRVAMVDYRLAPEHKFPCALDDAIAAHCWLAANAGRFGINPRQLAVCGDSVGANLAAGVCRWAKENSGPLPALQAMLCPVIDAVGDSSSRREFAEGYFLDKATLADDLLFYCPPGIDHYDPRLSPLRAKDFCSLPPAHIHTAEYDPVRDEGCAYAEKLAAAGVPVTYKCHAGMIHLFYGMAGFIPAAERILCDIGTAIGHALYAPAESFEHRPVEA